MDRQRMERERISPKSGPKSGREEGSLSKKLLTGCPVRRVHIIDTAFYLLVRVHLCQQSHGLDMGRGNSIDVRLALFVLRNKSFPSKSVRTYLL